MVCKCGIGVVNVRLINMIADLEVDNFFLSFVCLVSFKLSVKFGEIEYTLCEIANRIFL